ncbi:hypothetical protein A2U01_0086933, partial [Trifolium medium]|nr:hypothetical protein [Trifolium medium]
TDEEPLENKRKRVESDKAQPETEGMDIEANAGISKSSNDNVSNFQTQTPLISSPLNKPNDDIDPLYLNQSMLSIPHKLLTYLQ